MTTIANPAIRRAELVERLTHDDFMRLAPEDRKAELIDGEMIMPMPPFDAHERLQVFLMTVISIFVSHFDLGQVRGSRSAVYISEDQTYEPDILFVHKDRAHIITQAKLVAAPDLVVEILSASTAKYDRGSKLKNYAKAGVRELWLIDPYGSAGTQFYQRQGDELVEVASIDGIIHSVALPGFKLEVAWLWPDESDQLPSPILVLKKLGVKI